MVDRSDILDFSTVLASSVHDMKNSLGMLLGTLEEMSGQCPPGQCGAGEHLGELLYEGNRLNNHLLQLLAIYKMERSEYAANIIEHNVADCLEECAVVHAAALEPKGISIDYSCDKDLVGFFDRELVEGIIGNVVNNAFRYARRSIQLQGDNIEGGFVRISVADDGSGYPDYMLCNRDQPLHKTCFKSGSTGLGLYFSALVASIHRNKNREGYIECSNGGINGGGCFSLYIP